MSFAHFTVSFHKTFSDSPSHIDLFLSWDLDGKLVQYTASVEELKKARAEKRSPVCKLGTPHRRKYLDYQGPLSDGRGRVRILRRGKCKIPEKMFDDPPASIKLKSFLKS